MCQSQTFNGGHFFGTHSILNIKQEGLANAKISAQQQCVYKAPSKEIYGKSMQGT